MSHPKDIFIWSDGSRSYRYETVDMSVVPDEYSILPYDSDDHEVFTFYFA